LPGCGIFSAIVGMGAKYLPTIKDLKASQRFQQMQDRLKRQKALAGLSPKAAKKK